MRYRVVLPKSVLKVFRKLPSRVESEILRHLKHLERNPRPAGRKRLEGRTAWRIRIRDYRVIYEIDDERRAVVIYRVRHRSDVYR